MVPYSWRLHQQHGLRRDRSPPAQQPPPVVGMGVAQSLVYFSRRFGSFLRLGAAVADAHSAFARLRTNYPFHSARDMLYCARSQARTGDPNSLVQSVLLTVNWPKADASYDESQEILKDSSEQILVLANRWAQAGKIDDAVQLAGEIPPNTPCDSRPRR